jgi:hypothetical protein
VSAVAPSRLEEAIAGAESVRSVNFFNGRLLTGEDLRREQVAQQARLARLGEAAGAGVVRGLEAEAASTTSAAQPLVSVRPGLAVAPSGAVLELPAATDVSLAREGPREGSEPGGLFADCEPYAPGSYTAGSGVYLLTIGPAAKGEGRAAVSGLPTEEAPCDVAYAVEAVRFRLIRLALPSGELADEARLRNRVAHRFFGAGALREVVRNPFGERVAGWGHADRLRETCLTGDEVPLALIGWRAGTGIRWVDRWAVRRRLIRGSASADWPALVGERRAAEGEARFLQFQDQLGDLLHSGTAIESLAASSRFPFLPAAGLLPLGGAAQRGFGFREFFAGLPVRGPVHMAGAEVADLLRESFTLDPIDVAAGEVVWLYLVRENVLPVAGEAAPRAAVLFASGHARYRADARFELSYWNFANFAEIG